MNILEFYRGKKVFVTGHTGFKGSWLCQVLINAGASVTGYSLPPQGADSLFNLLNLESKITSIIGDIRNLKDLQNAFEKAKPEIVFHLAAQPLVRESYQNPHDTYETNVMGTVNLLECVRHSSNVRSVLNVTTDKVYKNNEWEWGYREDEMLDGFDPYSNSKSCSELVTHSYARSFFSDHHIAISTARAGNVIGGGDFAKDRIIPDCIRSVQAEQPILIRNPHSTRPYQHVLEPVMAYLMIACRQYTNPQYAGWYNVGPDECDCLTTGQLVNLFCDLWGDGIQWKAQEENGPHEANFLKLDCSKLKKTFGWSPVWHITQAVQKTCEWTQAWLQNEDIVEVTNAQINLYNKESVL